MTIDFLAILPSLSEEEFASWLHLRGARVVLHNGRYWLVKPFGFFHGIHPFAKMSAKEATRPGGLCWGFRTTLDDADSHLANAILPLHLLSDVANYDLQSLSPRRRNQIRNCFKHVEIIPIQTPDLLLEQGLRVAVSAHSRTNYGVTPEKKRYAKEIVNFFAAPCGLILGGLVDGRLAGYLVSYAVGSTAYVDDAIVDTNHLSTNISSALFFVLSQICKQSGRIKQVVHGLHTPENAGLCHYKETLGLSLVKVPAFTWFLPPTGNIIKRLRPYAYYRLKGERAVCD